MHFFEEIKMDFVVTLVMPVFNGENYLNRSLTSIINQSFKEFKLIIVDDGSTDSSLEIISTFNDKRIELRQKQNGGKNSALNLALSFLNTDYVTFVDQDDELHHDHIYGLVSKIRQYNVDMSICEAIVVPAKNDDFNNFKSNIDFLENTNYSDLIFKRESLLSCFFTTELIKNPLWNKLYRKELFEGLCFPEHYILDDLPMLYRIIDRTNNAVYFDFKSYFHYVRVGSVSRNPNFDLNYTKQISLITIEKFDYFAEKNFKNTSKIQILNNTYMLVALNTAKIIINSHSSELLQEKLFLKNNFEDYFYGKSKFSFINLLKKTVIRSISRQHKVDLFVIRFYVWLKYVLHDKI